MGLFDIFSTSFLITIALTMLALCLMFLYFSQKFSEQDHKISSMVDLVTTMAQEIHLLKNTSHSSEVHYPSDLTNHVAPTLVTKHNELIEVSDDDEESEYDDEESELDDEESELDDDDNDSALLESEIDDEELNEVNSLNIDEVEHVEPIEGLEDINTIQTDANIVVEVDGASLEKEEEPNLGDLSELKSISMTDSNADTDYKKMSVDKLRHVVVEKGLVVDASKLKKKDLLKLLGLSE